MSLYDDELTDPDDQRCLRCLHSGAWCLCPEPVRSVSVPAVEKREEFVDWDAVAAREYGERKYLDECKRIQAEKRHAVDGKPTHYDELIALGRTYGQLERGGEFGDAWRLLQEHGHTLGGKRFWE